MKPGEREDGQAEEEEADWCVSFRRASVRARARLSVLPPSVLTLSVHVEELERLVQLGRCHVNAALGVSLDHAAADAHCLPRAERVTAGRRLGGRLRTDGVGGAAIGCAGRMRVLLRVVRVRHAAAAGGVRRRNESPVAAAGNSEAKATGIDDRRRNEVGRMSKGSLQGRRARPAVTSAKGVLPLDFFFPSKPTEPLAQSRLLATRWRAQYKSQSIGIGTGGVRRTNQWTKMIFTLLSLLLPLVSASK